MTDIDSRLRYLGALVLFVIGGLSIMNVLELKAAGESFSYIGVLALFAIWAGCDWILKGYSQQKRK